MKYLKFSIAVTNCMILAGAQVYAQSDGAGYSNWKGSYFGLSFGAGQGKAHTSLTTNDLTYQRAEDVASITQKTTTSLGSGKLNGNMTGSVANLLVGYNFHPLYHPKWVFGGQVEGVFFSEMTLATHGQQKLSTVKTTDDGVVFSRDLSQTNTPYEYKDELSSMFTFVGRGGYLIKPHILAYILGGGVESNFVLPINDDLVGKSGGKWVLGYTLGAGLEYRLNDQWSFRGEYRFLNVDNISRNKSTNSSENNNPDGPNNTISSYSNTTIDYSSGSNFNMGMMGVIYRPY